MGALTTASGLNLLTGYLDVCSAASEAHRDSLPYKPVIAAYERIFADRQVGVDIYGSGPDEIETIVTIRLVNTKFELVPETEAHPSFHLKLQRHYMEDVVAHREEYIQHPEKLDWDWLKSRMGMEPRHEPARGANMRPPEKQRYEAPAKGANMRPRSGRIK
jgi:hypothetical protein